MQHEDYVEMKADIKELVKQGAVHNELLRTHEARSLALQDSQKQLEHKMQPIENHVRLVEILFKGAGAILVGALIQAAVRYLI